MMEILSNEPMKVEDTVYFYEHWSDSIEKCKIEELKEDEGVKVAKVRSIGVVDIDGNIICKTYGTNTKRMKDLYSSPQEAYHAYFQKRIENTNKYCEEIQNVRDLVEFPLKHCLNGEEYTNYDAKAAYKQRVKELLGIDLNNALEETTEMER